MIYSIFYREREKRLWGDGEYKAGGYGVANGTTKIGTPKHNIDPVSTIDIIKHINGANALCRSQKGCNILIRNILPSKQAKRSLTNWSTSIVKYN